MIRASRINLTFTRNENEPSDVIRLWERREEGHDEISTLVHFVGAVLAAGASCLGTLSDCLVDFAAIPHRGDCLRGRVRIATRDIVTASAYFARAASGLETAHRGWWLGLATIAM
jgi:hypothetical protein